ncbi:MAG: nodulation protein NfeD [candidate division WOR-3 bacterium]|nr:nodulation protein NfeD [candidate division WOR-3 bacterium]MDW7987867.1 nodulation protein NfeD [candidate division WOR-3 bacterium]
MAQSLAKFRKDKKNRSFVLFLFLFAIPIYAQKELYFLEFSGVISPVSASYIVSGIKNAEKSQAQALIIKLNTPGGLDESMREIVTAILNAQIPIITYVAPSGARAASAGVFIAYASHILAMAEGTTIGAAHPISIGGKEIPPELKEKITNDAVSYLVAISEKRNRNKTWAEEAVRKSSSVSAEEALKLGICDLIANNEEELLRKLDSLAVAKKLPSRFTGAAKKSISLSFRERILLILTNPNVAYILLMLGIYGLLFELQAPGSILPGVVGAICLILALYALSILPTNYTGLGLIGIAVLFFILEIYITSYGLLALGGILALILGSLLLFSGNVPYYKITMSILIAVVILSAAFLLLMIFLGIRAHKRKITTGQEGLIGELGRTSTELNPEGTIIIHGELWNAHSLNGPIAKGEVVKVVKIEGLKLYVVRNPER